MSAQELATTAAAMVAKGKGVLAIDESMGTIKKRFDTIGLENTEPNRRAYRDLLIANAGDQQYISGMILFDETIRQSSLTGVPFAQLLAAKGIMPGIKVDGGSKDLAGRPGEQVTEGLDGLRERLAGYKALGAKFAKWRAVITIGHGIPTSGCVEANAHALARYAAVCQAAGIVQAYGGQLMLALAATTVITGAIAVARLTGGWLVDHFAARHVAAGAHLFSLTGAVALSLWPTPLVAVASLAMIGMGYGVISGSTAGAIARYWHRNAFGGVASRLYIAWCVAAVSLPVLSGWLFDRTQGYATAVMIAAAGTVLGALLSLTLPKSRDA